MKLPHVNGSSESSHGSCDVPCLGSALRVRSAQVKLKDCFQSWMIAYARSRLAQVQGGTWTIFHLTGNRRFRIYWWWYLACSPSPPPIFMTLVRSTSNIHNLSISFSPTLQWEECQLGGRRRSPLSCRLLLSFCRGCGFLRQLQSPGFREMTTLPICKPLSRLQNRIWTGATSGPPNGEVGVNMYFYSWSKKRCKWKGL